MAIKKQITDPVGKWETIHPKEAASMLTRLHPKQVNRHNKTAIASYARQMTEGNWRQDIVNPIQIDWDNNLMNGYHRLNAVVTANVPVRFYVVRGLDPDGFGAIDDIVSRSLAFRAGITIARAAMINSIASVCAYPSSLGKMDTTRASVVDDFFKKELDYVGVNLPSTGKLRVTQAGVRAGMVLVMREHANTTTIWPELINMYDHLLKDQFTTTTPSMAALHSYLFRERHPAMRVLMASYHAFSPAKWSQNRLRIQDQLKEVKHLQSTVLTDLVAVLK